jgi:hypothetical protein
LNIDDVVHDGLGVAVPRYQDICREERHFAAVLFALMNDNRDGLRAFTQLALDRAAERRGSGPLADVAIDDSTRVFYEYSKPRDVWAFIDREPAQPRQRPTKTRNPVKRSVIEAGLKACGWNGGALPQDIGLFNACFTKHPSANHVMSPATWQLNGTAFAAGASPDPGLVAAADLLHKTFKIKPDIVVETAGVPIICIEAKVESAESRKGRDGLSQIELQRLLFRHVLGCEPIMVLLAQRSGMDAADCHITWDEAFACFPAHAGDDWVATAQTRLQTMREEKSTTGSGGNDS